MKKLVAIILVGVLVFLVVGCNGNASGQSEQNIEMFRTTEELAREYGGLFLKRGDKLYILSYFVPYMEGVEYDVMCRREGKYVYFAEKINERRYGHPEEEEQDSIRVLTYEGVPAIEIKKNDTIIYYPSPNAQTGENATIHYWSVEPGRTFHLFMKDMMGSGYTSRPELMDSKGNMISVEEEFRELVEDEIYTLKWHDSRGDYHEIQEKPNCWYFSYRRLKNYMEIKGKMTKGGYYILSMPRLKPGFYVIGGVLCKVS